MKTSLDLKKHKTKDSIYGEFAMKFDDTSSDDDDVNKDDSFAR